MDGVHIIAARADSPVQNVVAVGRDDQTVNRQTHPLGNIARKNITKIACWHSESSPRGAAHQGSLRC